MNSIQITKKNNIFFYSIVRSQRIMAQAGACRLAAIVIASVYVSFSVVVEGATELTQTEDFLSQTGSMKLYS